MKIVWTEIRWLVPGLVMMAVIAAGLVAGYMRRKEIPAGWRWLAGGLKLAGFSLLFIFLLRPEIVRTYYKPGVNHWAVLLDHSASMSLEDAVGSESRGEILEGIMEGKAGGWLERLEKEFVVDRYVFDTRLAVESGSGEGKFDGDASSLGRALGEIRERYEGRPLAGVLVITDGAPTDPEVIREIRGDLPPVFPLVIKPDKGLVDLSVEHLTAKATLFEDAPVMVDATVSAKGLEGRTVIAAIREYGGKVLEEKKREIGGVEELWMAGFQVRPAEPGAAFFEVSVRVEDAGDLKEATMENNARGVAANREKGPYRVLYVGGRPNYEHKFLQRALLDDGEIQLTSLLRIAGREPKFEFRGRAGEKSNPLYRGFGEQEGAERFDEPVFARLGTKDDEELSAGFPQIAEELFPFEAVILDDVEAKFFSREQQRLLQRFVSERGGGVLMLGGMESLEAGGYEGTAIGEMLPVYLKAGDGEAVAAPSRFEMTREGMLEPWARLRLSEDAEKERIGKMPLFGEVHRLGKVRPGALEVMSFEFPEGGGPAIAVRKYGRGRTAASGITDFWRWGLRSPEDHADLDKSWRQMVRWLLADVPKALMLRAEEGPDGSHELISERIGRNFKPDDGGGVTLKIRRPDQTWTSVGLRKEAEKAGSAVARVSMTAPGPYLAEASAREKDGKEIRSASAGWVVNSLQDEYRRMEPDMKTMEMLAAGTGGRILDPGDLDDFVDRLDVMPLPVSETRSEPLWHSGGWMVAAMACFLGEWTIRRWRKLT